MPPQSSEPEIAAAMVRRLALGLDAIGVEARTVFQACHVDLDALPPRMPVRVHYRLWQTAVDLAGERGLGVKMAALVRPEMYEVLGYVVKSSATLGDALERASRYIRLLTDAVEFSYVTEERITRLTMATLGGDLLHPEAVESLMAVVGHLAAQLAVAPTHAREVWFTHARPPGAAYHEAAFGVNVRFERPNNALFFDAELLAMPIRTHDSGLCRVLEQHADQLLARLPGSNPISRRVVDALSAELRGGNPSAEHVAELLGMHPKALFRALRKEGTSHQQLLDDVRHELSLRYLREPRVRISEVAFILGYSDASAFNKAFRRWTGGRPNEYRRKLQRDVPE